MNYGRVPFVGSCRSFVFIYVPGAGLPGAGASVFPVSRGLGVCQVRQHGPYRHQIRIKLNAIGVGYGISGRVSFDLL